jgi:hypothetical protein
MGRSRRSGLSPVALAPDPRCPLGSSRATWRHWTCSGGGGAGPGDGQLCPRLGQAKNPRRPCLSAEPKRWSTCTRGSFAISLRHRSSLATSTTCRSSWACPISHAKSRSARRRQRQSRECRISAGLREQRRIVMSGRSTILGLRLNRAHEPGSLGGPGGPRCHCRPSGFDRRPVVGEAHTYSSLERGPTRLLALCCRAAGTSISGTPRAGNSNGGTRACLAQITDGLMLSNWPLLAKLALQGQCSPCPCLERGS